MTTATKLPMKLSDRTINLLKNFASINQSILFKQGNQLRTISVMKNILAEANIDEDFPQDFGVYDLSQFLNSLGLFQEPELNFTGQSYVNIKEGKQRSKYFFGATNGIWGLYNPKAKKKFSSVSENFSRNLMVSSAPIPSVCSLSKPSDSSQLKVAPSKFSFTLFNLYSSILSLPYGLTV